MGDVVSSHLDEGRREVITARTRDVMKEFGSVYQQQYAVALFNSVRYEIEGGGGAQSQLLHRKDPLAGRSIFSGSLFQYLEENRKWRNRFVSVPNSYTISLHESKTAHERGLHPKGTINCAGYKALTSMEEYIDLINTSLPDVKAKSGSNPFIKCATQFPLILWHPYARHHYFCVTTEKEQKKWHAVLQDCVRHSNNGLSEDCTVQTPAFTDSVRLHRQAKGHYGTWDMMCGTPPQILANLVMESLHPELRSVIAPRLRGKMQQRQKHWMLISDALYRQVLSQTTSQYEALAEACEALRAPLDGGLRTDMDQIIASKEHVSSKMRALVLPKAEQLLRTNVQPYISSILEALMEPSSRGFSEVREVFFRELVEISKNLLNGGGKDKLGDPMERLSMLALHPVKMQSCYEKVEQLNLEGLQQRFDLASPSVFVSRAQTLMGQQMDNAVYTFEQLLNQSLETQGEDDMCKTIQRCQDRVLKKYDYDSSTVRKKFFRESLLQIIIPYMLQQLSPSCSPELPRFKELIFEDFSRFLLVENLFEEVVLQCVSKDIMMAVKEAAVQRRHNLYRDSIILSNSDPNLHLLEESPQVDWAAKFGGDEPEGPVGDGGESEGGGSGSRRRQVVSMIQLDGIPLSFESCMEVPGVEIIPEEDAEASEEPMSPDSVTGIRDLINPMVKLAPPVSKESPSDMTNGMEPTTGTVTWEDGEQDGVTHVTPTVEGGEQDGVTHVTPTVEDGEQDGVTHVTPTVEDGEQDGVTHVTPTVEDGEQDGVTHVTPTVEDGEQDGVTHVTPTVEDGEQDGVTHVTPTVEDGEQDGVTHVTTTLEDVPRTPPPDKTAPQPVVEQPVESVEEEADGEHQEEAAIKNAIEEREIAVQEDDSGRIAEGSAAGSDCEPSPAAPQASDSSSRSDSGFQSPSSVGPDEGELQPITNGLEAEDKVIDPVEVEVVLV